MEDNELIVMVEETPFWKQFVFTCSIGFNVGLVIGLIVLL